MRLYPPPCLLSDIAVNYLPIESEYDCSITGLTSDSREVKPGYLFLALPGHQYDGRDYIQAAIVAGASAVFAQGDTFYFQKMLTRPIWAIPNLAKYIGFMAANFYRHPAQHLQVIGITGTAGKTSCSQLLAHALQRLDHPCGIIGTLGVGFPGVLTPNPYTTPDAISLQGYLSDLLSLGAKAVAMEVSSHALALHRTTGIAFASGIFTNLTRDHLDFHTCLEDYAQAKLRLFTQGRPKEAILNLDDPYGQQWYGDLQGRMPIYGYSLKVNHSQATVKAQLLKNGWEGMQAYVITPWGEGRLTTKLLGDFNLYNLLAVLTQLCSFGYPLADVLYVLADLSGIPGRMESLGGDTKPLVVIDYAHKPDALEQVLKALRAECSGQLFCVIGCGGNRDTGKRPLMGTIADRYADKIILTNDNPRDEDPEKITQQIYAGISNPAKVMIEHDRGLAIESAIQQAQINDIVLIAGKGHETYQIIKGNRMPFSDKEYAECALGKR